MFEKILKRFSNGKGGPKGRDAEPPVASEPDQAPQHDIQSFLALYEGLAPQTTPDDEDALWFTVRELGTLVCPTGKVEASDPLRYLGTGLTLEVPPGTYSVRATLVRAGDEPSTPAYLSLVLSDARPAQVVAATSTSLWDRTDGLGHFHSLIGVDSGMAGFIDVGSLPLILPSDQSAQGALVPGGKLDRAGLDTLLGLLPDDNAGSVALPRSMRGENLVVCPSGLGDGVYDVLVTFAADGQPTGVHIDFGLLGFEEAES